MSFAIGVISKFLWTMSFCEAIHWAPFFWDRNVAPTFTTPLKYTNINNEVTIIGRFMLEHTNTKMPTNILPVEAWNAVSRSQNPQIRNDRSCAAPVPPPIPPMSFYICQSNNPRVLFYNCCIAFNNSWLLIALRQYTDLVVSSNYYYNYYLHFVLCACIQNR